MKSQRTDGNFIISLLIKIQLWSGTRTTLARFKEFIYTQYYGQISEPQKISTTSKLALPTVFKIQDWKVFSKIGNFVFRPGKLHTYKGALLSKSGHFALVFS